MPARSRRAQRQRIKEGNITVAAKGSRLRVRLVDDHGDTVETTALLFQTNGHETRIGRDGAEAIEQSDAFWPYLILLDIHMPKMDGFEVLRQLRRMRFVEESVIVAVTNYAHLFRRRRCAEAGFDLHLPKFLGFAVFEQLLWFPQLSSRLPEESSRAALQLTQALVTFIGTTIQMASSLHDVWAESPNADVKSGSLAKARKIHNEMAELVGSHAAGHMGLVSALGELRSRHKSLSL